MEMPGLTYSASDYRYGFNSKEKDAAFGLLHYDYGFRIYHPGLGRFLSVDPLTRSYPSISTYAYVANNPINAIDPDGRDIIILGSQEYRHQVTQVLRDLYSSSPTARKAILKLARSSKNFIIVAHPGKDNAYIPHGSDDGTKSKEADGYLIFNLDQATTPLDAANGRDGEKLVQTLETSLAHEIKHMFDDLEGISNQMAGKKVVNLNNPLVENPEYTGTPGSSEPKYHTQGILAVEPSAVDFENKVRSELFMPLRTHYGGIDVFNKKVSENWKTFGSGEKKFSTYTLLPLKSDYSLLQQNAVKSNLEEVFKADMWWDKAFKESRESYSKYGINAIPDPKENDGATRIKNY